MMKAIYSTCSYHLSEVKCGIQVEQLVSKGLKPNEVCVLAYDKVQIDKIRRLLRGLSLNEVKKLRIILILLLSSMHIYCRYRLIGYIMFKEENSVH